jgi:addiction module HigA family antidote
MAGSPLYPGEVLLEEFMKPLGVTAYALASRCGIPRARLERIVREKASVNADTALRLAKFLGTTPEYWLNLQARYELETTASEIRKELAAIKKRQPVPA